MPGIRLSEKHGVNPTIPHCFYCNQPKNELILMGRLPGDAEAPRGTVFDKEPCDKCKEFMTQGIILISTKNEDEGKANPYRTGGWCVVKERAIEGIVQPQALVEQILKARVCFIPDAVWDMIGLPREE